MKKRTLPIPLILLIPILLLVMVIVAGIYRFSLSDQEILGQHYQPTVNVDPIVEQLFSIQVSQPLTIQVPQSDVFAFVDHLDVERGIASAQYSAEAERGEVLIDTSTLSLISQPAHQAPVFAGILMVSNQGSGVFYYLATFRYDAKRSRMISVDSQWLGDRIVVENVQYKEKQLDVDLLERTREQSMAQAPTISQKRRFLVDSEYRLIAPSLRGESTKSYP
ncbi:MULTISPECIES: hypothetical protein [Vibrio]|uniref:Uncharacterized protein n=1 Tax=Vibrio aestuarianus TaxID=28171 RepID=A0A9X4FCM5_9VIBR|nr:MULTISPECIES: hypothetical protein [Vibrio]MDE1231656.1 hypothetical protein [Vibrio aestuarianus]MDE1234841.1 hypothetical protein [Vibrio aestuarianus]MDE1245644.1 hypothetical protein [Vibrio aestuarianus]MDE1316025.1 hypothetical protein [Vibrio aestuarianus]MDE1328860.1 hypothetical protein [Vibrio aestuarianus]